jgi:hypothetical protein
MAARGLAKDSRSAMNTQTRVVQVPSTLEEEIDALVAAIKEEVRAQEPEMSDSDLVVERQHVKGMIGGAVAAVILYVGGIVASKITEKWVEEVLWPKIKPRFEKHTDDVLALLKRLARKEGGLRAQ